jgi:acetyltransferase-like isoleucine patch superfamily enzyme
MFLNKKQIEAIGFKYVGEDVLISDKASFHNPQNISIGDYSRIDDFALISASTEVTIGKRVHIACHTIIIGRGVITLDDYSAISSRTAIYSSSDPYDGSCMTNPCVPESVRTTYSYPVHLGKHVVVGTGCTILPGVTLADGCAVGAMTLVNKSFEPNCMIVGIPGKKVKDRKLDIYTLQEKLERFGNLE